MDENKKNKEKDVCISTRIDWETNQLLKKAAKKARRSKHNEMAVRLKDHLKKFPCEDI
jgi:uncharacterized protein (DUF1778 family)